MGGLNANMSKIQIHRAVRASLTQNQGLNFAFANRLELMAVYSGFKVEFRFIILGPIYEMK